MYVPSQRKWANISEGWDLMRAQHIGLIAILIAKANSNLIRICIRACDSSSGCTVRKNSEKEVIRAINLRAKATA